MNGRGRKRAAEENVITRKLQTLIRAARAPLSEKKVLNFGGKCKGARNQRANRGDRCIAAESIKHA